MGATSAERWYFKQPCLGGIGLTQAHHPLFAQGTSLNDEQETLVARTPCAKVGVKQVEV